MPPAIYTFDLESMRRLGDEVSRLQRMVRNTMSEGRQVRPRLLAASTDKLFRFTLTEDMGATTALKASASIRALDGSALLTAKTVEDVDDLYGRALSGAKGLAFKGGAGNYHAVECEQEATMYYGLQVGALLTSDSTNGIDNLEAMNGQATVASSITANNTFSWAADDNAGTFIVWNASALDWDMIQVLCPA